MSLEMKWGIIKYDVANSLTIMELFKHCKNLQRALKTQYKKFNNFTNPNTHDTIFYLFTSLVITNCLNFLGRVKCQTRHANPLLQIANIPECSWKLTRGRWILSMKAPWQGYLPFQQLDHLIQRQWMCKIKHVLSKLKQKQQLTWLSQLWKKLWGVITITKAKVIVPNVYFFMF